MKKHTLVSVILFCFAASLSAQIVIEKDKHALDLNNESEFANVEFIEPGEGGENIVWDYSNINFTGEYISGEKSNVDTKDANLFDYTPNIKVSEGEHTFYYQINDNSFSMVGITNDTYTTNYTKPLKRMVYPFSYQDSFEGNFQADAKYNTNSHIDINGSYKIEADGYGVIKLPNNQVINVLRVKQYSKSTQGATCYDVEIESYKYLWYSAESRYPIVSTSIQEQKISTGETKITKKTFINEKVLKQESASAPNDINENIVDVYGYSVSPNPFVDLINVSYQLNNNADVSIGVYTILGAKVTDVVVNNSQEKGTYTYTVPTQDLGLTPGLYFVKFKFNDTEYNEKIIKTQ